MSVAPIITMSLFIMTSNTYCQITPLRFDSTLHRRARHAVQSWTLFEKDHPPERRYLF
jgi:hypothetical protein